MLWEETTINCFKAGKRCGKKYEILRIPSNCRNVFPQKKESVEFRKKKQEKKKNFFLVYSVGQKIKSLVMNARVNGQPV